MMKLNCDLGEFAINNDAKIMPFIDLANIACGFHGSDPATIQRTIKLAKQHQVTIGAHPSYPDKENFGRKSMQLSVDELVACLQYQVGALLTLCAIENVELTYVKPHGALYNDMMKDVAIFSTVCLAIEQINRQLNQPLSLMLQALPDISLLSAIAKEKNIPLLTEAFADRAYRDDGLLVARNEKNALLTNETDVTDRCRLLLNDLPFKSINQQDIAINVDTLCVHGDTPNALAMIKSLRMVIDQHDDSMIKDNDE